MSETSVIYGLSIRYHTNYLCVSAKSWTQGIILHGYPKRILRRVSRSQEVWRAEQWPRARSIGVLQTF